MVGEITLPEAPAVQIVPAYLVKEEYEGVRLYYKGYRRVLAGNKTLDEIMAGGGLHSLLVTYIVGLLLSKLDATLYRVLVGEVGSIPHMHIKATMDIAVFEKSVLPNSLINRRLIGVPPLVDIEVDVQVENPDLATEEIVQLRTQKLLDAGTKKVIWIFSLTQKITVAEQGKDWVTFDWNRDVEVVEGINFNVHQFLREEGYDLDSLLAE